MNTYGWTIALGDKRPPNRPPAVSSEALEHFSCTPMRYYTPDEEWKATSIPDLTYREFLYDGRRYREEKRGGQITMKVWSRIGEIAARTYHTFDGWTLVDGSAFVKCTNYECEGDPIAIGGVMEGGRSLHKVRCPYCSRNLGYIKLADWDRRRSEARSAEATEPARSEDIPKQTDVGDDVDYPRLAAGESMANVET